MRAQDSETRERKMRKNCDSSPSSSSSSKDSPPRHTKCAKHARSSPGSISCGTPWEVVKAREELAAIEAACVARLCEKIDRHERKKHMKKHR